MVHIWKLSRCSAAMVRSLLTNLRTFPPPRATSCLPPTAHLHDCRHQRTCSTRFIQLGAQKRSLEHRRVRQNRSRSRSRSRSRWGFSAQVFVWTLVGDKSTFSRCTSRDCRMQHRVFLLRGRQASRSRRQSGDLVGGSSHVCVNMYTPGICRDFDECIWRAHDASKKKKECELHVKSCVGSLEHYICSVHKFTKGRDRARSLTMNEPNQPRETLRSRVVREPRLPTQHGQRCCNLLTTNCVIFGRRRDETRAVSDFVSTKYMPSFGAANS